MDLGLKCKLCEEHWDSNHAAYEIITEICMGCVLDQLIKISNQFPDWKPGICAICGEGLSGDHWPPWVKRLFACIECLESYKPLDTSITTAKA